MVVFPCCKINLGLHVISKRSDGFHEIETCFYPVPWCDILEIIPSDKVTFHYSGRPIPSDASHNLCEQAFRLLKTNFIVPDFSLQLHKVIPLGAGLGGGSSDAAAVLTLLNERFELKISLDDLSKLAANLGSDCSFFLNRTPMIGRGRGEILSPVSVNLKNKIIVVLYPEFAVSTKEAYQSVNPRVPVQSLSALLTRPLSDWKHSLMNDFENALFPKYPLLSELKQKLYDLGAFYASMSGSGSAIFGLFDKSPAIKNQFTGITVWSGILD